MTSFACGRSAEYWPDHLQDKRPGRGGICSQKLDDADRHFGVQLVAALPTDLKGNLPTIEELESELGQAGDEE